ncbi:MAG TPA: cytochrome-c oxidase, cbb3-type subunit III [Burkholderiales bacterium]|nr:cytochrome-c oxidase, cbb3-type subunit III [Burkholderiales bacterium]
MSTLDSLFVSGFWDLYIAVVSVVSIVACALFLRSQSIRRKKGEAVATTGHVWDEDLAEYNNPLPSWWRWLFYITVAFALVYLVLYPGLGSWRGTLGWSQVGQFERELERAEARFGPRFEKFAAVDIPTLARDPEALAIGQKLFLNNCAQCHASDGGGSRGFPNLTDGDWLYGGTPEAIRESIAKGRTGVMPPLGAALGEQKTKNVAHYVLSLSGSPADSLRAAYGKEIFAGTCAACHGADGKGNIALGAPNLTDRIWLHGSGEQAIVDTITRGRTSQMPAHEGILSPARIHLLSAYVYSLGKRRAQP